MRSLDTTLGLFVAAICALSIIVQPTVWVGYALMLVPVVLLSDARRGVRITATQIRAQGRFVRRVIPLAEVTQVGQARTGTPWVVQRRADGTTRVSMLWAITTAVTSGGPPASATLLIDLRRRATEAGATLEPELTDRTRPPSSGPLIFGL